MNIYEFMMALGLNGSIEDLPNMDLSMMSKEESKMREMDVWNFLERERNLKQENELCKRENEADLETAQEKFYKELYDNATALKADLETAQEKFYKELYDNATALKADLETAQEKFYKANARNGKLVTENQDLNRQLKEEREQIKTLLRENGKRIEELNDICHENHCLKDQIESLKKFSNYQDLETRCKKLEDENMALKALLTEKNVRIKELEKQLEECCECCLEETMEEDNYIPGLVIEAENVYLTVNNWPEPLDEDEEEE